MMALVSTTTPLRTPRATPGGTIASVTVSVRSRTPLKKRSTSGRRPRAIAMPIGTSRIATPMAAKLPAAPGSWLSAGVSRAVTTSAATAPKAASRISSVESPRRTPRRRTLIGQSSRRVSEAVARRRECMAGPVGRIDAQATQPASIAPKTERRPCGRRMMPGWDAPTE